MSVQFDDDISFERQKIAMQGGRGPGSIPRVSTDTKLALSICTALMIGLTLFIWLRYISVRPVSTNVRDMQTLSQSDI